MAHEVFCVKLKKQLPGLDEPPFDTELGQKIYDNVSQEAWRQWTETCKMILNEYRLNPARREDQEVIVRHMEQFFFGEGAVGREPALRLPKGARRYTVLLHACEYPVRSLRKTKPD